MSVPGKHLTILPRREQRPLSLMDQARAEARADAAGLLADARALSERAARIVADPDAYAVGVVNVARTLRTALEVQTGALGAILGRE